MNDDTRTKQELIRELASQEKRIAEMERSEAQRKRAEKQLRAASSYSRSLIEASLDPLVTISSTGKITDVNTATEKITGVPRDKIIGSDFYSYFTEPENARAGYQQVLTRGYVTDYPLSIRHTSGAITEVLYNASVYRNEKGEVLGVFAAARDITERKRGEEEIKTKNEELAAANEELVAANEEFEAANEELITTNQELQRAEEALRAASSYSRNLIEVSLDPLVTISAEGKITDVNTATEKITGMGREMLIGSDFSSYFTEPENARAGYQQVLTRGYVTDYPLSIRHQAGTITDLLYNAVLYQNEDGSTAGVFAAARDITERKRAEEALKKTMADLERSNKELEQFAYVASHDLQEPLRMVASFTQLLAKRYRDKLDADANEFINYAVDGANRMQKMVNDLLSYSRVGHRGKSFEPTDCTGILNQALTDLNVAIDENEAVITHDALPVMMGDESQLVQLFQNLIGNGIKFRSKEAPRIHISAQESGNEWIFTVQDNGIGIDPQYNERIFMIFQRLHGREEYPGTGIGLAICKKIVECHGGRVWVDSQPGNGSTFYFTIPKTGGLKL